MGDGVGVEAREKVHEEGVVGLIASDLQRGALGVEWELRVRRPEAEGRGRHSPAPTRHSLSYVAHRPGRLIPPDEWQLLYSVTCKV